jgi:hypothetical protein
MTSPCRTLTQTGVRDGDAAQQDMATTLVGSAWTRLRCERLDAAEIATSHVRFDARGDCNTPETTASGFWTGLGSPPPRPVLAPLGLCTRIRRDKVSTFDVVWALSPISGCPSVVMPLGRDTTVSFCVLLMARRWEDERLLMIAKRVTSLMAGFRRPPAEMR